MKTILIAGGDMNILRDIRDILSIANYNIFTANNGKEAMEAAKQIVPDLIVTTLRMPVIDGLGMLYMLRNDPKTETIPVILLISSNASRNDFRDAMESGADDFMLMPFSDEALLKTIGNRFRSIQAIRKSITIDLENKINEQAPQVIPAMTDTQLMNHDIHCYQKNNLFFQELKDKHYLYFLCNDKIKACKAYEDGKQLVIGLYNADGFLGHVALLGESTCKKLAEAIEQNTIEAVA